jgi:hypothetical protein
MALPDLPLSGLTLRGTPDRANDYIYVVNGSTQYRSTINNELGITGTPVGTTDSQTLTNKVLTAPTISSSVLSGTITGTYTLGGTPTFPASVVTLTGSQTLTNKVLTSPTISSPTITNASITADAISGFSTANTGTIYGVAITSGAISGSSITSGTVGAAQLSTSAIKIGYAQITSNGTVASSTRQALSNTLSVTVTVPAGGRDIEITFFSGGVASSAGAGTTNTIAIMESTTSLGQVVWEQPVAAYREVVYFSARVSAPSAGSHTYLIHGATTSGTLTVNAGTANPTVTNYGPAWLLVKVI